MRRPIFIIPVIIVIASLAAFICLYRFQPVYKAAVDKGQPAGMKTAAAADDFGAPGLSTEIHEDAEPQNEPSMDEIRVECRAVYLIGGKSPGIPDITEEDLRAVHVVDSQDELKKFVDGLAVKKPIWVDINAAGVIDKEWLEEKAINEKYPIVAIGSSNALYSFRDALGICSYMGGPYIPPEERNKEGFSIYRFIDRQSTENSVTVHAVIRGFNENVSLREVLNASDTLNNNIDAFRLQDGFSPEQKTRYYYWLLKSYPDDEKGQEELIGILPSVDWRLFWPDDEGDFLGILEWVSGKATEGDERAATALLKSRTGLDAAFAEGYYYSLGQLLDKKMEMLLKVMAGLDQKDIDEITPPLAYEVGAYKELKTKLSDYRSKTDNEKVRQLIDRLLENPLG